MQSQARQAQQLRWPTAEAVVGRGSFLRYTDVTRASRHVLRWPLTHTVAVTGEGTAVVRPLTAQPVAYQLAVDVEGRGAPVALQEGAHATT